MQYSSSKVAEEQNGAQGRNHTTDIFL